MGIIRTTKAVIALGIIFLTAACTPPKETHESLAPLTVAVKNSPYSGPKYRMAIGKLDNQTRYMNGIFSDGVDRLGMQAQQNLATHLAQSNRFVVVDRLNMAEMTRETTISATTQKLIGADILVTGAVTEFGRRETGTAGLGGILQRSRTQTAYSTVTLSLVDVKTSQIIYSVQGSGTFDLTNEHVLGFGSEAGYDATLTDRVLNLATIEAVNRIIEGLERNEWKITP
jgi:curli biogenesis system outer membrane secretion channel CsgG